MKQSWLGELTKKSRESFLQIVFTEKCLVLFADTELTYNEIIFGTCNEQNVGAMKIIKQWTDLHFIKRSLETLSLRMLQICILYQLLNSTSMHSWSFDTAINRIQDDTVKWKFLTPNTTNWIRKCELLHKY